MSIPATDNPVRGIFDIVREMKAPLVEAAEKIKESQEAIWKPILEGRRPIEEAAQEIVNSQRAIFESFEKACSPCEQACKEIAECFAREQQEMSDLLLKMREEMECRERQYRTLLLRQLPPR